jgi:hypothetical protein
MILHHQSRDEVVAVSRLKACTATDATPGSPRHHGIPPGPRPGGLAATKQVLFSDPLVSSPSSSLEPPRDGPRTVFLPGEEVFARPELAAPSQTRYTPPPPTMVLDRLVCPFPSHPLGYILHPPSPRDGAWAFIQIFVSS